MLKCSSIVYSGTRQINCNRCLLAFSSPKVPICRIRCVYSICDLRQQTKISPLCSLTSDSIIRDSGRWAALARPSTSRVARMPLERRSRSPVWRRSWVLYILSVKTAMTAYISRPSSSAASLLPHTIVVSGYCFKSAVGR